MEVYLDSDILIDFLRGDKETVEIIRTLEEEYELATTSINLFELYYGAYKTGKSKNIRAVDELASRLEVSAVTGKSAKISGNIIAELESDGKVIDFRDALIAAVVIESGCLRSGKYAEPSVKNFSQSQQTSSPSRRQPSRVS